MSEFPTLIFWRTRSSAVLVSVFGPVADAALARDGNGVSANKAVCRQQRPYGVTGWRLSGETEWRDLATCPLPAAPPRDTREGGLPNGKPQLSKYGR